MNQSKPSPLNQVDVAYSMLGNALRYGPDVISRTEAEKWLEFIYLHAKNGAARMTEEFKGEEAGNGN